MGMMRDQGSVMRDVGRSEIPACPGVLDLGSGNRSLSLSIL